MSLPRSSSIALLILLTTILGFARAENNNVWSASWISPAPEIATQPNSWLVFRGTWSIDSQPAAAPTRIAVDSKYWLWVNGQLVIREGGLKRGPRPQATYYDEVDLAPYLTRGENTLAVLVWFWGRHGFSHVDSGRAGLVLETQLPDGRILGTDTSWRIAPHPAFGSTGEPHPNYRLSEANVHFDARKDLPAWPTAGFDDSAWPSAIVVGPPPAAPWHDLVARPIPQWRDYGVLAFPEFATRAPTRDANGIVRARLPYNAHVHPIFTIAAPAGLTVDIRTDHYRGGGPPNVRTEYVTRAGVQTFECPAWMNGHTVEFRFPPEVTILDLAYRETGYDTDFVGSFACDDPLLNQLWQESIRTLYVTLRDNYMDCPDRERAQWWGDVVIELGQTFYALDRRSDAITRKAIRELIHWQREDGTLYSPVPAGNWDKELPTQMLASIGHYGFWTYIHDSGDLALAAEVMPAIERYLTLWQIGEDGLVEPRAGGWTWGDWGEEKDLGLLYQGWYALALIGQRDLYHLLDRPEAAAQVDQQLIALRTAFHFNCWDGTAYRSPDHTGAPDDRGNGLAVVATLAPSSTYSKIRDVLRERRQSSPYMEKYVLEALIRMGFVDDALARMKSRYAAMLADDYTTLYEGWGIGAEGFGGGTINHAWSGGPLTLLSRYIAGVAPLAPGFARFEVAPRLGPLNSAAVVVPSAAGRITAATQRDGDDLVIDVVVPPGTEAEIPRPAHLPNVQVNATAPQTAPERIVLSAGEWSLRFSPSLH